jgi:hypothetical protein
MEKQEIITLLTQEYFVLQGVVESYNQQSLIIKGWSVTVGMAALIAAYALPVAEAAGRAGVVLAALAAVPFYLTDALWKSFQEAYYPRIRCIEDFLRKPENDTPAALQISFNWNAKYEAEQAALFFDALTNAAVYLPHAFLFGVGLFMAFLLPPARFSTDFQRPNRRV